MAKKVNNVLVRCVLSLLLLGPVGFGGFAFGDGFKPYLGEDGIYHYDWYHQSFLELGADLNEALSDDKVLMIKFDQKGCIYCEKVALEILSEPAINAYVREHFVVVQLDLYGGRDVTDLDGDIRAENEMARKWGVVFTPTIYFLGGGIEGAGGTVPTQAGAVMPGAFGRVTFLGFLEWVVEEGYRGDESFQRYFTRRLPALRSMIDEARRRHAS